MKIYKITLLLILAALSNIYSQDWEQTGLGTMTIYSLAINSNGHIFAGTHLDGVFRSTDEGASWTNLGITNYDIYSIVISSNGDILVAARQHGGIFRSTDNGNIWTPLGLELVDNSIAINSNGDIFVGTDALGIWRTTNNGANWDQILFGPNCSGINSIIINSIGYIFAGTIQGGTFRSTNNGDNWTQIIQGLTELQILSLAINSSGDIFAGTSGGGVFRSTDNGDNWEEINLGITGQGLFVYSLATISTVNVIAGTDDGTFRSTNNGNAWVQINQGLTNNKVHSLAKNSIDYVFAGTEGGIFRSLSALPVELTSFKATINQNSVDLMWQTKTEVNNYGFSVERRINECDWNSIGFVEGNGNSNSPKEYSYSDKDLFAGGSNFQYRLKQVDTDGSFEYSDVVEVEVVPNQYELSQNYPNPFNPSTTIRFSLPQASQIKINIYNMIGEQVATIADGMYEAGYHKVTFNASDLPSGAYVYRIESSDFVQVKKMILMK